MSVQAGHTTLTKFLERAEVPYEVVEHERTQTAAAEARAAGMPPSDVAKTVVLRDEEGVRLAVVPSSERLDMHKVKLELARRAAAGERAGNGGGVRRVRGRGSAPVWADVPRRRKW